MNLKFVRFIDRYIGILVCGFLYIFFLGEKIFSKKDIDKQKINKILLIKFFGIGNIVMLMPTMAAIRKHFPDAEIDILSLSMNKEILEDNRFINNSYYLNYGNVFKFALSFLDNIRILRKKKYDMVLDFEQFAKISSIMAFLTGARIRIGFETPAQRKDILYTNKVMYLDFKHMSRIFARIAMAAGVKIDELKPIKIDISPEHISKIKKIEAENSINQDNIMVGVHAGTSDNFIFRRWPRENFARLADLLIDRYNARIIFTGVRNEKELVEGIISIMHNKALNLCGQLNIKELCVLIERCDFFISNDTAPVHIASAMGTPVVAIFGPNTPFLYGPRGDHDIVLYNELYCSPCMTNFNAKTSYCREPKCIYSITVEDIFDKIEKKYLKDRDFLKKNKRRD